MNRFNNVIFGQKAFVINSKKQLLILKRKEEQVYVGYWDVPGGKLDDEDDLLAAISREIKEETGLKLVKIILTLSSSKFIGNLAPDKPLVLRNIYLCSAKGKIKLSPEHSEYKWEEIGNLKRYKFPEDKDFQWVLANLAKVLKNLDLSKSYSRLN
jgi:ADP-ribose pyrophosphatase YjhB (NUDIX family)